MEPSESQHPEIPAQFPVLNDNKGNITYSLTLDKSINKAFGKFIALIVINSIAIGGTAVLAVWMIIAWSDAKKETRVQTQEIIYTQAAVAAHGIPIPHPERNLQPNQKEK